MNTIYGICITPYGKIEYIWLSDSTQLSPADFKQKLVNKDIEVEGTYINKAGNICMTGEAFSNIEIKMNIETVKKIDINITKIIYETMYIRSIGKRLKVVKELYIDANGAETAKKLVKNGFKLISIDNNVHKLKIEYVWLIHLVRKVKAYENLLNHFGIDMLYELNYYNTVLFIQDKRMDTLVKSNNIILEEVNTHKDELNNWVNKAKLLGIIDDYSINIKQSTLERYYGKRKNANLPPVYIIDDEYSKDFELLDYIKIPNSVCRIENIYLRNIRRVEFGENLIAVPERLLANYKQPKIDILDTKNLNCLFSVRQVGKLIYRLQFGDKDDLTILGPIDEVEIVENT